MSVYDNISAQPSPPCEDCRNRMPKPNDWCDIESGQNFCDSCCLRNCLYFAQCYTRVKKSSLPHRKKTSPTLNRFPYKKAPWGIDAQLVPPSSFLIEDKQNLIFDTIGTHYGKNIMYDPDCGTFTVIEPAIFIVSWQIGIEDAFQQPYLRFALFVNGSLKGAASSCAAACQLQGYHIITTTEPKSKISLVNHSGGPVKLHPFPPAASLTIHSI